MSRYKHNYERKSHPLMQRLGAILHIIFDRNFILITGIKEFKKDGQPYRKIKVVRRTDYGGESDYLSCLGGAEICKPKTKTKHDAK